MEDVYEGMVVQDANGRVGVVHQVQPDPTSGAASVIVLRDDGTMQTLVPGMYMVMGDALHIDEVEERETGGVGDTFGSAHAQRSSGLGATSSQQAIDTDTGGEVRIPVIQEEVVVGTREVERGGVRVHKTVNEREEVVEQPVLNEEVNVERVAIGRIVETVPQVREEGDTLIIPVLEEVLVVEKRLVLKEEIRVTRRRTQQTEQARVVLREEQVRLEDIDQR